MWLNISLTTIMVLSVAGIVFLFYRHWPRLRILDVSTVPEAQRAEVRDRLLLDRMKRNSEKNRRRINKFFIPFVKKTQIFFSNARQCLLDLEKKYRREAEGGSPIGRGAVKRRVETLLEEASALSKLDKFVEAEKVFIEVISLDPKNIIAYRGLVDVYLEMKEYGQAMQTAEFVLKLELRRSEKVFRANDNGEKSEALSNARELADAYVDLGYVAQLMSDDFKAITNYENALETEPNNPRNLTLLLERYLAVKRSDDARKILARLEDVNPDNQKLSDYRAQL